MTQISSKSYNSSHRRQQRTPYVRYFLLLVISVQAYRILVRLLPSDDSINNNNNNNNGQYQSSKGTTLDDNGEVVRVSRKQFSRKAAVPTSGSPNKNKAIDEVLTKHGTGPAKLGYVVDLVEERKHAPFRDPSTLPGDDFFVERSLLVSKALEGQSNNKSDWKSCEVIDGGEIGQEPICREANAKLGVHNGATFPRFVCGTELRPGQSRLLENCDKDEAAVHMFRTPPTVDGNHGKDPPIRFVPYAQKDALESSLSFASIACDIPCEFERSIADIPKSGITELSVNDWKVRFTYDDPYFNGNAKIERTDFQRDVYYATTSFRSSVPLSFYNFGSFSLRNTKALPWSQLQNKATYLIDSDCTAGRRNKWSAAVKAIVALDAYGSCDKTTELKPGESIQTMEGRLALLRKNRIALILEKGTEKDHITEQVYEALIAGVIPAVNGAGNLEDRVPKGSIISSAAFNSWDKFAEHIKKVSEDQQLWESFHAWRTNTTELERFEDMYQFVKTEPQCRLCRWAYAKQYGLGWDHKHQTITKTHIDQSLCIGESSKLITKPFKEGWGSQKATDGETASCTEPRSSVTIDNGTVRKVYAHDGVVDLQLVGAKESVLSLTVGVRNTGGAYFRDVHTLTKSAKRVAAISSICVQDSNSKVTILADWETKISSPKQGIVEIVIEASTRPQRIRVITEDLDDLHDKLTEFYPSKFGQTMMLDFIDPLEYFYKS